MAIVIGKAVCHPCWKDGPKMTDRNTEIDHFLAGAGWGDAQRNALVADASFRRYERISRGNEQVILMDAPPAFEDVRPFVNVARFLTANGFRPPEILAEDADNGFLLLEDFGNDLLSDVLKDNDQDLEKSLYQKAISIQNSLHEIDPPHDLVPAYDEGTLMREVCLFTDWYMPALTGRYPSPQVRQEFMDIWQRLISPVKDTRNCLVLRDYHADNLMILTGGELGLLDFQDALVGHPAYDLVSLLQDARRDVSPDLEQAMISQYLEGANQDEADFLRDYALLGAQRNCKIIGIFARLFLRDNKDIYLSLIPRVWGLLERCLDHPALQELRDWINHHVPASQRMGPLKPIRPLPSQAMVLAAGLGTRMRPLTENTPKPLVQVAGRSLLQHGLDMLIGGGIRKATVNQHHHADQMTAAIQNWYDKRLDLSMSDERDQLLDSGGGVKKALPDDDAFIVMNSDQVFIPPVPDTSYDMVQLLSGSWQPDQMDILMLLVPFEKANGYDGKGDFNLVAHTDDLAAAPLVKPDDGEAGDYVYTGLMIMKPDCFEDTPDGPFSLRVCFDRAREQGRLYGALHKGEWYHVGTPESLEQTHQILTAS